MKRIAIDLALISPGKAEFGGGIWVYISSILKEFDNYGEHEYELICFVNPDFFPTYKHIRLIKIPINVNNSLLRLIWTHFALPLLCIYYKVDLLHKIATEIPFLSPTKTLATIHDLMIEFYLSDSKFTKSWTYIGVLKAKYFIEVTKRAIKKSESIIVPSNTIRDEIIDTYKPNPNKIIAIHQGWAGVNKESLVNNVPTTGFLKVAYISSFYPHKGHIYCVRAFSHLLNNYTFINTQKPELFFRGHIKDREYFAKVVKEIEQSGCKDKFHFENYEAKSNINDIYAGVSILFLLTEYEGFGIPVIEAQALGIPVICSDIKVFREILGDSAVFVNFKNEKEVSAKLYELLSNKEMQLDYKQKGLINSSKYDWQITADKTWNVYKDILR